MNLGEPVITLGRSLLVETMPQYAATVCAQGGKNVEAFVIEGYTDDLGDDLHNLRLSQERSFAVLAKSVEVVREKLPGPTNAFSKKRRPTDVEGRISYGTRPDILIGSGAVV